MQEQKPSKFALCVVAQRQISEIAQRNLSIRFQHYVNSVKTNSFLLEEGGKEHRSEMYIMQTRTQPRSFCIRPLLRSSKMLFVRCYDGHEDNQMPNLFGNLNILNVHSILFMARSN